MDLINAGNITILGNFSEILPEKPKDFDYMSCAKWIEDYPMEWREVLGKTVCSCTKIEVHYAPYYGYDYYHLDSCSLMQKIEARPQIRNLFEVYLPRITQYKDAVPADTPRSIFVHREPSTTKNVKVRLIPNNLTLF